MTTGREKLSKQLSLKSLSRRPWHSLRLTLKQQQGAVFVFFFGAALVSVFRGVVRVYSEQRLYSVSGAFSSSEIINGRGAINERRRRKSEQLPSLTVD